MTKWTRMASFGDDADRIDVFEDFGAIDGAIAIERGGVRAVYPKSAEPTSADPATLYRGHSLAEVLESEGDLLGREILALPDDPSYADVAACLAPISEMVTYAFVGSPETFDKVGAEYGGRTPNFDPAELDRSIAVVRDERRVLDGLVGGWLPVLRFVYPIDERTWSELVMFAAPRLDTGNNRVQPVWYRVSRVEGDALSWVRYIDTFPSPASTASPVGAEQFYRDLLGVVDASSTFFEGAMQLDLPDQRLADQARHSLLRARATRFGDFPKYGVMDRLYGGSEHDGFQDTFTSDVTAALGWGLLPLAARYIDNYFEYFVRDDGSILYRGPETGQLGRMLAVVAQYHRYSGDDGLLLRHRVRLDAVADSLIALHDEAMTRQPDDSAYGVIAGWCEADSCLEDHPDDYRLPYLSNSAEAGRGLGDLGAVWARIGARLGDAGLARRGDDLCGISAAVGEQLQTAIARTILHDSTPPSLPTIAGATEPFDVAVTRDRHDPQFRAYRANMELLFSGLLTTEQVELIARYREARHDIVVGVPAAYGYDSDESGHLKHGELAGFLSYGHAYGLLQHDLTREYLLELYSLSAHQYTRGTWTAPETRRIDPALAAAPYAVPAQLAIPMLLRWMLAFEDPVSGALWIGKAIPRDWLANGKRISASRIPTDAGHIEVRIESRIDEGIVDVALDLGPGGREVRLRLRTPGPRTIAAVVVDGRPWTAFHDDIVTLPGSARGAVAIQVRYA